MIPNQSTDHTKDALAHLTSAYQGRPVITGILSAYTRQTQEFENAVWQVLRSRLLTNNPTGHQLDLLGALVDEDRNGRGDVEYLAAVQLKIRVVRSNGTAEDVIAVALLASGSSEVRYRRGPLSSFEVDIFGTPGGSASTSIAAAIGRARAATSSGVVSMSTFPRSGTMTWDSVYVNGGPAMGSLYVSTGDPGAPLPLMHSAAV